MVGISTSLDENSIFNILLYYSTLIFYLFTKINLFSMMKSNSL